MTGPMLCGKEAYPFIPRWGWYFACARPIGHVGPCEPGGTCWIHGRYIGSEGCPRWPTCIEGENAKEMVHRQMLKELWEPKETNHD
jgi:hypothetical protein